MPSLPPAHKLLLDENVRAELYRFLKEQGFDIKLAPKGSKDEDLARISKEEKRILVTNDQDFSGYTRRKVFAVVWLRIPQNDPASLLDSFQELLKRKRIFQENLLSSGRTAGMNFH